MRAIEAPETRQRRKREMEFGGGALRTDIDHSARELRFEMTRAEELEEREFRIGVRDDDVRRNLFAVGETHASCAVLAQQDRGDRTRKANLRAGGKRSGRHRVGDSAHATARNGAGVERPALFATSTSAPPMKQVQHGLTRAWTE